MREWLRRSGADSRLTPFDLRSLANQATVLLARELGAKVDDAVNARSFLQQHPEILVAVEQYRTSSEALASFRENETPDAAEDVRLNRERVSARNAMVAALEEATGRTYR